MEATGVTLTAEEFEAVRSALELATGPYDVDRINEVIDREREALEIMTRRAPQ